jgi:hypothetical protein
MKARELVDQLPKGPIPVATGQTTALMDAALRFEELSAILALGLVRLKARQSSRVVGQASNSSLHSMPEESVCGPDRNGGTA